MPDSTLDMPDSTPHMPDSWHTRVPLLSAASGLKWVMATSHVVCLCVCLLVCVFVCLLACFLAWRSRCSQQQREADVINTGTGVTLSNSGINDSLHKCADFQPSFLVRLGTTRKPGTCRPWSIASLLKRSTETISSTVSAASSRPPSAHPSFKQGLSSRYMYR